MGIRPLFRVGKEQATQLFRFVAQVDIRCAPACLHCNPLPCSARSHLPPSTKHLHPLP